MKRIFTTTLRLNLGDEVNRRAWERLRDMDKRRYKSYSNAINLRDEQSRSREFAICQPMDQARIIRAFLQRKRAG